MKKVILLSLLSFSLVQGYSQSKKAYAITADVKGSYNWVSVKEIDLATGEVIRTVFDPSANTNVAMKSVNGKAYARYDYTNTPMFSPAAAAAYDEKHNRLYFTNMKGSELRYFDLNTTEVTVVVNTDPAFNTGDKTGEENVITRMVIGADGFGYALSNDGNSLLRFSTEGEATITNLRALIDAGKNGGISVHNLCTSWGGDMIADAYGNLYLFSMRGHVFKINPNSRVADHLGTISGLPANFTINGAAVDVNGDVVVSSAVLTDSYYKVNLGTLSATAGPKVADQVWNASDLASANIAYKNSLTGAPVIQQVKADAISVYPNPVSRSFFNVSFEKVLPGNYTIELTDANGKKVLTQVAGIKGVQSQKISLPGSIAGGMYLVRVINADGKTVYNEKIVVQ